MMRNSSWRLLLLRNASSRSSSSIINSSRLHSQVRNLDPPQTSRYFSSSFITPNAQQPNNNNFFLPAFDSDFRNVKNRFFTTTTTTSESDFIDEKNYKYLEQDPLFLTFSSKSFISSSSSSEEEAIRKELDSLNISTITHDMVLTSLKNLKENHESALILFNWVSLYESERLSSKSYNLILGNLGRKEYIKDFWNVVEVMRKKGYGLSKGAYLKVSENFEKEEDMLTDLARLKEWFTSNSGEHPTTRVCKVIREHEWDEQVQKRLGELKNINWSSDVVVEEVLEHLSVHPMKALMFFWWIEETPSFKHTHNTYNAMIKVLGREDCIDKFWRVIDEMKGAGYALEKETYVTVMGRFYNRRMIKDAVDLYEFMMQGPNKPLYHDTSFLLRKIVVDKDLDMDLFARVLGIFTQGGNSLTKSLFDGVLKSLASVSRLQECGKVLKAMEQKGGFVANTAVHSEVIFQLGRAGKVDECYDILKEIETSGSDPNSNRTWASMIQGQCEAGYVDAASTCFRKMVEKNGAVNAGYPFELLVDAFCRKRRAVDAFKFLSEMVSAKQLQPWHSTYKMLIQKLLVRGNLKEALSLIGLMKNDGFPPFLDPFINYISKSGNGDDAISFLEAISVKKCPSTSVFIRMFEAFFKAGRHNEAQDCLSKCPGYIRSHADVLNLFFEMKPEETVAAAAAAVVAA